MSSYAGLHCEVIQGYSKGAGYKPGMKLEGSRFRNSWTAVCIDGSWCFLNCNWGARHVRCASQDGGGSHLAGHGHHGHGGRRRRGSCAKENIDCRLGEGRSGVRGRGDGREEVGRSDPYSQTSTHVIVTPTAQQSCLDSKFIVDNHGDDRSLLRGEGREKDSPLRQLMRYASGDILTARNGDRSSSASAHSSDRTSTGSTTTTSSFGKSDGTQSDSGGSHSGSEPSYKTANGVDGGSDTTNGCSNGSSGDSNGSGGSQGEERAHQYYYQCDEFYFITDPEDHIFQHYPDDPAWQVPDCDITNLSLLPNSMIFFPSATAIFLVLCYFDYC